MSTSVNPFGARRKLLLLATLFALPMVVAYVLYFGGWRPAAFGNHGELVQPARALEDVALARLDGAAVHLGELRGRWALIAFSAAECLGPCERNLVKMRQVIAAQGKASKRIQSLLIVQDAKARDWLHYAVKDYPGMLTVVGPPEAVAALARQFALPAGSPLDNLNRIYVVDPLGNFMMSYAPDADANDIRKDLARLLRVSRIG